MQQRGWLPAHFRSDFQILLITFKAHVGLAPSYLNDLLTPSEPACSLRFSGQGWRLIMDLVGLFTFSLLCAIAAHIWVQKQGDYRWEHDGTVLIRNRVESWNNAAHEFSHTGMKMTADWLRMKREYGSELIWFVSYTEIPECLDIKLALTCVQSLRAKGLTGNLQSRGKSVRSTAISTFSQPGKETKQWKS